MRRKPAKTLMEPTNEDNQTDSEQLNFTQPDFKFEPHEHHEWRQQGPYLVCKSCEVTHAVFIGMDKVLSGLNEQGQPILKPR